MQKNIRIYFVVIMENGIMIGSNIMSEYIRMGDKEIAKYLEKRHISIIGYLIPITYGHYPW